MNETAILALTNPAEAIPSIVALPAAAVLWVAYGIICWHDRVEAELKALRDHDADL